MAKLSKLVEVGLLLHIYSYVVLVQAEARLSLSMLCRINNTNQTLIKVCQLVTFLLPIYSCRGLR